MILRLGDVGPNVEIWQRVVGVDVTGTFNQATLDATRIWQTHHGLQADGVVGALTWGTSIAVPAGYVEGFDCAWPQGKIDWDKVPEKYRFVFVQVANGEHGRDPTGPINMAGARRTRRMVFTYLFFNADQDAEAQAENFWQACGEIAPACIAIDFETLAKGITAVQAVDKLRAVVKACRARFGRIKIVVYTYPNFDLQVIGAAFAAAIDLIEDGVDLWIADYGKGEAVVGKTPWVVVPWSRWGFWQTSGNNSSFIPGIGGHVDHDVFIGTEDDLRAYLGLNGKGEDEVTTIPTPPDFEPRVYDE